MVFKKFLVAIVSLNMLVSQLGVNVFALYCCCSRNIAYSLLPQEDECARRTTAKLCGAAGKCCSAHPLPSGPCKNRVVDYIFLDYDAQKPDQDELPTLDISYLPTVQAFPLPLDIHPRPVHAGFNHLNTSCGANLLLMHCIRRC